MNKKYTVFLSSTYDDLREERREVIHALLEMDCIPCSMETFPADDAEQFEFIKSVIDECDYYILIIAGRYGTVGKNGKSFTEMEYRYAIKKKIPVVTFIHNNIGRISLEKSERSEENRLKLDAFIKYASKGKLVKYWNGKEDLAGKVSRTMISVIKRHPAIGWVRSNYAINDNTMVKMQNLYEENLSYKEKEYFQKEKRIFEMGNEKIKVVFNILKYKSSDYHIIRNESVEYTWNELFKIWGQVFIEENIKSEIYDKIGQDILSNNFFQIEAEEKVSLSADSFREITIQFIALGLLIVVHPDHSNYYDFVQESRYRLTKEGEDYLVKLLYEKNIKI